MNTILLLFYMILSLNIGILLVQVFGVDQLLGLQINGFINIREQFDKFNNIIKQYSTPSEETNPLISIIKILSTIGNILWNALITLLILILNVIFGVQEFILNFPTPVEHPIIDTIKFVLVFIITTVEIRGLYEVFRGA